MNVNLFGLTKGIGAVCVYFNTRNAINNKCSH